MIVNLDGEQHNFPDDASEDEIRSALSALPKKPPSSAPNSLQESSAIAGGFVRGIPIVGPTLDTGARVAAAGIRSILPGGGSYADERKAVEDYANRAAQENPNLAMGGELAGGVAALAPVGATALGARALGITGSLPARLAAGAASGAGISAADTAARGGNLEDIQTSAQWGAGLGAATPAISAGVRKAISPFRNAEPTRAAAVATLEREMGQPVTAGQATGSRPLQWMEQHLGELGGVNPAERTAERFTSAALRRAGENATRATPEVIDRAFTRIGQQFDNLAANNTLHPDPAMGGQIRNAIADYDRLVSPPSRVPAVRQYEEEIAQALATNNNTLPGDVYKSLRSRMEADARGTGDHILATALRGMRGALDDAMERHLTRIGSSDAGAWQQARNQYRNLLVLDRAATNPNTKLGLISPATLFSATKAVQGTRNLARGRGDFAGLAQAGSDILRELPSSGTAQRAYYSALPGIVGGGVLGGVYGGGDPTSILTGAILPPLAGRAIMSRPGQAYLRNQLATGRGGQALQGGITGGLLGMLQQ